jgi:hypothetical protein
MACYAPFEQSIFLAAPPDLEQHRRVDYGTIPLGFRAITAFESSTPASDFVDFDGAGA